MSINISKKERTHQDILAFILEQGSKVSISQRSISKGTGYSASTVARTLSVLEERNLIRIEKAGSQAQADTIIYTGPKHIKRSVIELFNSVIGIMRSMLSQVAARSTKIKYIDDEIPETIEKSDVLLYKHLSNVNADMIILRRNEGR